MKIPVPPLGADATRADDFEVFSAPSLVRFLSRGVQPPSQIYLKHTDVLRVQCASSQAGESVTFNYRLLRADGALIKGQFIVQVPATRAVTPQSEPMAEGFLLSLSCKAAVATTRGQTFARAFLTAGAYGPNQPSYTLMADYVTTQFSPAHPNGRVLSPVEGPGWVHLVFPGALVVGADWSFGLGNNSRLRIDSFLAQLITSAAAAPRYVRILIGSGGFFQFQGFSPITQAASTTINYTGTKSAIVTAPAQPMAMIPLPIDFKLSGTDFIQSTTTNLDVGDSWSNVNLHVEEWLDNV